MTLPAGHALSEQLTIRLSSNEKRALVRAAALHGQSIGAYIREALGMREESATNRRLDELEQRLAALEDLAARAR